SIPQLRSPLELEVPRAVEHLLLQLLHLSRELLLAHRLVTRRVLGGLALADRGFVVVYALDDVLDALRHAARRDAARGVLALLLLPPPLGLLDRAPHGIGHMIGVEDRSAVDVARGAAYGLDERALGAQEPFLVRVQYRDQRYLRQVEPFAQQVDADQ